MSFLQWYMATVMPVAALADIAIMIGGVAYVAVKLRKRRMKRFSSDESGVAAVEAAIVMPVVLVMFCGAMVLAQAMNQKTTVAYVAEACAMAGARVLAQGGNQTQIQAAAQSVFDGNSGLWIFGAQPSLQSVTLNGNNVVVTVASTSAPIFPLPGFGTLAATATATD
ncbi:MAG TPA: TadE/TadG family type IV pilus assembly protein [Xanthobacteraceae bacterium]|nr:TadE/TadG family type IV pilus assembly protein [Xanthobacteraceae bacterium]